MFALFNFIFIVPNYIEMLLGTNLNLTCMQTYHFDIQTIYRIYTMPSLNNLTMQSKKNAK